LSLELASYLRCEIVGADARQIFTQLDIGTAKPTIEERGIARHHCIDIRSPHHTYTAAEYARDARAAIDTIPLKVLPIIVGGSGLYLRALLDGLSETVVATDPDIRDHVMRDFELKGRDAMYEELRLLDPRAAEVYADRNPRRVQRALEFIRTTGGPFSSTWDSPRIHANVIPLYVGITQPREVLLSNINIRCDRMWEDGLLEETRLVLSSGVDPSAQSLQTVGYSEAISVIQGRIALTLAQEDLKVHTRRYAKRQLTWFKRDKRILWISGTPREIASRVLDELRSRGWYDDFVDLHLGNKKESL